MRRGCVACLALAFIVVALVGCGRFAFDGREAWRTEAEQACLAAGYVQPTAYMSRVSEIDGPGSCGISYPFRVSAFAQGTIGLTNRLTLGCPIIPGVDAWLQRVVRPAAQLYFGQDVADIRAGSYSCRPRNNQAGGKFSEHSFGNAVDVMAFRLTDGREITIKGGWKGPADEAEFLREVFLGACRFFTTVLGPGADPFHYDHFHLDLGRHDPSWRRRVCKPAVEFERRLGPDGLVAGARPVPGAIADPGTTGSIRARAATHPRRRASED